MRNTLLSLAALGGIVAGSGAAHAAPPPWAPAHGRVAHAQPVQYYDRDWREHEYWRHRREEDWRRRQAWREREELRDRRGFGGPPAVVVAPPPVVYGRGW